MASRRVAGQGRGLRAALTPLGRALLDHHRGRSRGDLIVRWEDGDEDRIEPRQFFRTGDDLDPLERSALDLAVGRVLDVGAGAGAMSVPLVRRGVDVTALELLHQAGTVLRERGVPRVVVGDLWSVDPGGPFDTVLALLNGTGLAGTLRRLPAFLARLSDLGGAGCRILVDSTEPAGPPPGDGRAAGEAHMQLCYGGACGPPFPHLFAAADRLAHAARSVGLRTEVLERAADGRYLARLHRPRAVGGPPPG